MKANESTLDRIFRVIGGIGLLALGIFSEVAGAWQIAWTVIGAVLLLTGLFGFCPLYRLFNVSTRKS